MKLRCRTDGGKLGGSGGGALCSTKSHMTRNCYQTAICEESDRSSSVWCLLWMSGTQQRQIWCKWGFCLGNCASFFVFLKSGFWLLFLHLCMGLKTSQNLTLFMTFKALDVGWFSIDYYDLICVHLLLLLIVIKIVSFCKLLHVRYA